jgi:transcriptional regulator with XRE-family HTH domain
MLTARECGDRLRRAREARGLKVYRAAQILREAGLPAQERDVMGAEAGRVLAWNRLIAWVEALGYDPAIVAPELCGKGGGT